MKKALWRRGKIRNWPYKWSWGLDKLCLIVENEKFYTENPPDQSKRENEVWEGSKVVVQTHSDKSTCDLYSKVDGVS